MQGDANFVIWQASIGKTARECLYDPQGGLTLKVGISGRVIAGPKGERRHGHSSAQDRRGEVPGVGARDRRATRSPSTIPAAGSTVFTEVKEIAVPSPGKDRDYIIYVGFDVGNWDPMHAEGSRSPSRSGAASAGRAADRRRGAAAAGRRCTAAAAKPDSPNELPTPTGGFVLAQ